MTSTDLLIPEIAKAINGKPVILDTNAFVAGYSNPEQFSELLDALARADCPLTTIEAVRIEFLSKNRSIQELNKK